MRNADTITRLLSRVFYDHGCWTYAGRNITGGGYCSIVDGANGKRLGHRVAYEALVGPIPPGLCIDHLCRNRRCVNPLHLEAVSIGENTRRGDLRHRKYQLAKTHCPEGHPYDEANTHIGRNHLGGQKRGCRACNADAQRRRAARKRAQKMGEAIAPEIAKRRR